MKCKETEAEVTGWFIIKRAIVRQEQVEIALEHDTECKQRSVIVAART